MYNKVCFLCPNSSKRIPDVSFFHATDHIKRSLDLPNIKDMFICEMHFDKKDIKSHGGQKRLNKDAIPISFPKKEALLLDHSYFSRAPLDLVSWLLTILFNLCYFCDKNNVLKNKLKVHESKHGGKCFSCVKLLFLCLFPL